jgi:hypothetical protein
MTVDSETRGNRITVDAAVRTLDPLSARALDGEELEATLDALGAAIVTADPVDPAGAARAPAARTARASAPPAPAPRATKARLSGGGAGECFPR